LTDGRSVEILLLSIQLEGETMKLRPGAYSGIYEQIKGAARVLFWSQGFKNTSVTDLVEYLQIEEHVFFIYFHSMDELLEAVWSES